MNSKLSKLLNHWGKMRKRNESCSLAISSFIKDYDFSAISDQKTYICKDLGSKHGYGKESCRICIFSAVSDDNFPMNQLVEEIANEPS